MHPLIVPGGLLLASFAALLHDKKSSEQPQFAPEAKAMLVNPTRTADGANTQTFKPEIASVIIKALANSSLVPEQAEGGSQKRIVYKVVPAAGNLSAAQAIFAAQAAGHVVIGTLSLSLAQTSADKFVVFCDPSERKIASPQGHFAILFDSQPKPIVTPAPFDQNLPPNVLAVVNGHLSNQSPNTTQLRGVADTLEAKGYAVAARAIRSRAEAVDLERQIATPAPPVVEVVEAATVEPPPTVVVVATEEQRPKQEEVAVLEAKSETVIEAEASVIEAEAVEVVESHEPSKLNGAAKPTPFSQSSDVVAAEAPAS